VSAPNKSFFRHKLKRNHLRFNHLACIIFSTTKIAQSKKNTHPFKIIELKIFSFPKQNCPIEKNTHPFKIIDLKIFSFPKQNCPIEKNTHPFKISDLKIFSFPKQNLPN
jgi:hypothetical protein